MSETHTSTENHHEPGLYEIRLKGHLDDRWADWFDGLTITRADNGETLLTGPVVDQAALHGLLRKVRDLGMPLVSVITLIPHRRTSRMATRTLITIIRTRRQTMNTNRLAPVIKERTMKLTARISSVGPVYQR